MKAMRDFMSVGGTREMQGTHSTPNAHRMMFKQDATGNEGSESFPAIRINFRSRNGGVLLICKLSKKGWWVGASVRDITESCLNST
jgi:hypothetical protein